MTGLAREYGEGLYALAAEEKLEKQMLDELKTLKKCFRENPDFLRLMGNMSIGKEERLGIVDHALRGQVHPYVLNFLKLLCERGAANEFALCETVFREAYNREHGVIEARVTTGAPLTPEQRARLTARLKKMTAKEVTLKERVDASLLGGVVLEMEGKRYDNSVAARLEKIHEAIAGRPT